MSEQEELEAAPPARVEPPTLEVPEGPSKPQVMVTWLGEKDGESDGPSSNEWNGIVFKRGEPVLVENPHMIAKAKGNRFYSVEEK